LPLLVCRAKAVLALILREQGCAGAGGEAVRLHYAAMSLVLETRRLILRTWTIEDFEDAAAMYADPEVMRYLSVDGRPLSRYAAWQAMSSNVGHWTLRGFGMFAIVERESGTFVGRVGPWLPEGWPAFEIGWTLRSQCWGKGYATEAANRCIEYAFLELGRSHVASFILPDNTPSIRVAERVGERLERTTNLPHLPDRPVLQYGLSREQWESGRRPIQG
jgi:RimJ/RimL family protein N-acetyltransferase